MDLPQVDPNAVTENLEAIDERSKVKWHDDFASEFAACVESEEKAGNDIVVVPPLLTQQKEFDEGSYEAGKVEEVPTDWDCRVDN